MRFVKADVGMESISKHHPLACASAGNRKACVLFVDRGLLFRAQGRKLLIGIWRSVDQNLLKTKVRLGLIVHGKIVQFCVCQKVG